MLTFQLLRAPFGSLPQIGSSSTTRLALPLLALALALALVAPTTAEAKGGAPAPAARCVANSSAKSEPTLQSVFDSVLPTGTLDAANGCLDDAADSYWSGGSLVATIVAEWAGNANFNEFGIYDATDPGNRVTVFDGVAGGGAIQPFAFATRAGAFAVLLDNLEVATFATPLFGFFLSTPYGVFFSDSALNPYGADQMLAYAGSAGAPPFVARPGLRGISFGPEFFLLAFEDLPLKKSDRDFQDFVVLMEFAAPIPLPGSAWLLLGACGMLIGLKRRGRRARMPATV